MKLKGLIFDFDGLIIDTESPAFNGLKRIYSRYGLELKETTFGKIVGTQGHSEFHEYQSLADSLPVGTLTSDEFERMYQKEKELEYEELVVLPGVREMIGDAKKMGLSLAIASSSSSTWVNGFLARFGLLGYFDVIVTSEQVANVKPEPDLFLMAQQLLGLGKDEVVIFEDSFNGVIAANKAGIPVILIPNPVTKHLDITGEALRVNSMAELTIGSIEKQLS